MKRVLVAVAAVTVLVPPSGGPVSAAPDGTNCVIRSEFRQVHRGTSFDEVRDIFGAYGGAGGHRVPGQPQEWVKNFLTCADVGLVEVTFKKDPKATPRIRAIHKAWPTR